MALVLAAALLAGCFTPQNTEVAVYVDAPEALPLVQGLGWNVSRPPLTGLAAPPGVSLGPIPLRQEDAQVVRITWQRGSWPGRSDITWDETVEYSLAAKGLSVSARNDQGLARLQEDVRAFLAQSTTLDANGVEEVVRSLSPPSATWPDDPTSPLHAHAVVDLAIDLPRLMARPGMALQPHGCCAWGLYLPHPTLGDGQGWSIDLQVTAWQLDPNFWDRSNETNIVVSAAGRLYAGGDFKGDLDHAQALATVRRLLDAEGLAAVSLEGAQVHLHGWSSW
jgi:hypothetical protein